MYNSAIEYQLNNHNEHDDDQPVKGCNMQKLILIGDQNPGVLNHNANAIL